MWRTIATYGMTVLWVAAGSLAEVPHPRLWFQASDEARLKEKIERDPLAARLQAAVMVDAKRILTERTCRYEIPDGKRLLAESRRAFRNTMVSAWAWRVTGEKKYRSRALAEMTAACAMKDWNPKHFLDTAEMATAVATGYDWLYPTLTTEQRAMCERAIIDKALTPIQKNKEKRGWWKAPRNNWSQVCGSGMALAAAAVAGNDGGLSENVFGQGLTLIKHCEILYQPDGMYDEGPGYWHYGSNYHVMLLAASGILGHPIKPPPVLKQAGDAIMHLTSPTRMVFNFADAGAGHAVPSPAQCWLAAHYQDATQARHVRDLFQRALDEDQGKINGDRWFPLAVLWLPEEPKMPDESTPRGGPPLAAIFHGRQSVALFRSGWDMNAKWLGIKGGTASVNHGHMDVGSFVYDAHGERWIHDLGAENYNFSGYFGQKRWTYYRLQNRSHNTLEIGGKLQNADAKPCPLIRSSLEGEPWMASFDLSAAYSGSAREVRRTAYFERTSGVVRMEDQIVGAAGEIVWRAFTDAQAEVNGSNVVLRKKGKTITLRNLSPSGVWSIQSAAPPTERENRNDGFQALVLTIPRAAKNESRVEIRP